MNLSTRRLFVAPLCAALLTVAGCLVGPDYKRPEPVANPPGWGWKFAEPRDEAIKGDWWKHFGDPQLDRLEAQATAANQTLRVAVAHVDQARAAAGLTKSRFFPQLSFDPSINVFHTQLNHVPSNLNATNYAIPLDLSYEVDLWGRVRRSFESAQANAQASVADYYQVLLTLHGDVATNYFLLRQLDDQLVITQRTYALRQKTVKIVDERHRAGMAPDLDVQRASTELSQTQTLLTDIQRQRTNLQDALALLCGQAAPSFQIASGSLPKAHPDVPVALPSALLERRPDIAAAERHMVATNAQIGAAKAAYFPAVSLTANAGYATFHPGNLLDWDSHFYSIGPNVSLPLFNGGRLKSNEESAVADYHAACGTYQQQVLAAFKDVSDALNDLDGYTKESTSSSAAVASAQRAADSAAQRYRRGLVNYLDVIEAQRTELQAELSSTQISAQRLISTVHLFKSLGGGFDQQSVSDLPKQGG